MFTKQKMWYLTIFILSIIFYPLFTGYVRPVWGNEYTINSLVDIALSRSKQILAQKEQSKAAKFAKEQAGRWDNPLVSAAAGKKNSSESSASSGTIAEFGFSQEIPFPGKMTLQEDIAGIGADLSDLSAAESALFIRYTVIKLAYGYTIASQMVEHLSERVARFRLIRGYLYSRPQVSSAQRLARYTVENKLAILETERMRLESQRDILWEQLNFYIKMPAKITISSLWMTKGSELYWPRISERLLKENIDIKRQRLIAEKAKMELALAEKMVMPDVTIQGFFNQDLSKNGERVIGGGVSLPIPLWNRYGDEVNSKSALAAAEDYQKENNQEMLLMSVRSQFIQYQQARQNLKFLPMSLLDNAHRQLIDSDAQFQRGLVDVLLYLETESSVFEIHQEVFTAQLNFISQYTDLLIMQNSDQFEIL